TCLQNSGADYVNFKAGLGATPIYCILVDKREWRFYTVDFETRPFSVQRSSRNVYITGKEGSLTFIVEMKNGKTTWPLFQLSSSLWISFIIFVVCIFKWIESIYHKISNAQLGVGISFICVHQLMSQK